MIYVFDLKGERDMKYCSDFVTNSSSSSFICVFDNKESFDNVLQTMIAENISDKYINQIYKDLQKGVVPKSKVYEELRLMYENIFSTNYYFAKLNNTVAWESMKDWDNEEYKKRKKEYVDEKLKRVKERLPRRGVYLIVEYEDHTDFFAELEKEIMPYLSFVFTVINNH